jgi:hypothetical protein
VNLAARTTAMETLEKTIADQARATSGKKKTFNIIFTYLLKYKN